MLNETFSFHAGREKILCDHRSQTSHVCVRTKAVSPPRQCRQVAFISEFTTDTKHVLGEDNPVSDALSKVDFVMMLVMIRKSWHNNRQQMKNCNKNWNHLYLVSSSKNSYNMKQTVLSIVIVFRTTFDHSFQWLYADVFLT